MNRETKRKAPAQGNGQTAVGLAADQSRPASEGRVGRRSAVRAIAVRLFLTSWLVYTLHFATNIVREIYPALTLGDSLSVDVSEYVGLHPDIFEYPGRGAFINNNPGASFLGAIPYALARPVIDPIVARVEASRAASGAPPPTYESVYPLARDFYQRAYERGLDVKFGLAAGVMQAGLMAPVSALSAVVIFYLLLSVGQSPRAALILSLLYAFATPIFYRTAQLNHNLLQSHFALFSFALLWRPWAGEERMLAGGKRPFTFSLTRQTRFFALAGLLAGWTLVLDYSGIVLVAGLGLYALLRWWFGERNWADVIGFGIGAALSVSVLLIYQWAAFGHPIYPAQHYMPETQFSGAGYQGMDWPQPDLLWILAFGMRYGLFTSAPFLLLALYPPAWWQRRIRLVGNLETWFILILTITFFLFTAANQFARMQFNTGVRHIVPLTPFLFLIAAGSWRRLPALAAALFGIVTTYWSWCLAMYRDVELGLGIPESLINITLEGFRLPWMQTLQQMGFVGEVTAVPILLVAGLIIWALWAVPGGLWRRNEV